ncbi:MAG: NAD(P)-binding domain-containing protein, partial [Synergistaceae bacterium]|nr:NAD(P)-binding domain-containing protein [Synergistaceae bacterium]
MEKERIGFIGLGIMGKRMAANLLAAGYPLVVRSSRDETRQFFASRKAAVVQTPEDVARLCDIIITMLPDSPEVKEVVFGTKGIFGAVRSGQVYIDMSSIDPASAKEAAEKLAEKGVSMLDAPVSGGQEKAENGTLSIMVGGDREVFERCLPIFSAMGR